MSLIDVEDPAFLHTISLDKPTLPAVDATGTNTFELLYTRRRCLVSNSWSKALGIMSLTSGGGLFSVATVGVGVYILATGDWSVVDGLLEMVRGFILIAVGVVGIVTVVRCMQQEWMRRGYDYRSLIHWDNSKRHRCVEFMFLAMNVLFTSDVIDMITTLLEDFLRLATTTEKDTTPVWIGVCITIIELIVYILFMLVFVFSLLLSWQAVLQLQNGRFTGLERKSWLLLILEQNELHVGDQKVYLGQLARAGGAVYKANTTSNGYVSQAAKHRRWSIIPESLRTYRRRCSGHSEPEPDIDMNWPRRHSLPGPSEPTVGRDQKCKEFFM